MKQQVQPLESASLFFSDSFIAPGNPRSRKGKAVEMEDIKFHQCVRLARFENDRTISFIPPDGEVTYMENIVG
jgi:AP-1 complex subunit mu